MLLSRNVLYTTYCVRPFRVLLFAISAVVTDARQVSSQVIAIASPFTYLTADLQSTFALDNSSVSLTSVSYPSRFDRLHP